MTIHGVTIYTTSYRTLSNALHCLNVGHKRDDNDECRLVVLLKIGRSTFFHRNSRRLLVEEFKFKSVYTAIYDGSSRLVLNRIHTHIHAPRLMTWLLWRNYGYIASRHPWQFFPKHCAQNDFPIMSRRR